MYISILFCCFSPTLICILLFADRLVIFIFIYVFFDFHLGVIFMFIFICSVFVVVVTFKASFYFDSAFILLLSPTNHD